MGLGSWMSSAFCDAVCNMLYYSSLGKEAILHSPITVTWKKYIVCAIQYRIIHGLQEYRYFNQTCPETDKHLKYIYLCKVMNALTE